MIFMPFLAVDREGERKFLAFSSCHVMCERRRAQGMEIKLACRDHEDP